MSRLQKFKKKKKFILISKFTLLFYLLIFSFSYLSSATDAYFNSSNQDSFTLQAGTWFDGSELVFIGKGNQNIKVCPEVDIIVEIKNVGFEMIGPAEYEVFYVENGEPRVNGEKIDQGLIEPLGKDEIANLVFEADDEGFYEFKAIQREGYEGSDKEIWSEKIKVKCNENNNDSESENEEDNSKDNESIESEDSVNETDNNEENSTTESKTNEKENSTTESGDAKNNSTESNDNESDEEEHNESSEEQEEQEENTEKATNEEGKSDEEAK
ncbi:amyloid fiber anchoring/assembly protein TapA [Ornithinibacillus sp. L9]|uniref:Amyloid fiber anchoring/assembly protein TapA n=1 Tax=Ornithinibacillus caprae TaxID=2678566 RepID=A0A6N8FNT5_9BACI|nr:amyloid fiber anchoring/assembly protein TapA [Ornithinibacillus caprae]MUK89068.1 amyloid fiber anchoring/assembly protein TapA [Ornithinibacillus caprae]